MAEVLGETVVMTVRSGPAGSGSESQAGSVLGTPAYMAPEQARGDVERMDERTDVFGLGAILCEILAGRPPYAGATREEIRDRAARGDLADAMSRLDDCGADEDLVALAKGCLAAEPEQRPRDAGEVSRRLTAYLVGVQDRLRAAELARAEAQARAEEERKRRRVTVALAASVLALVVLGGGGWAYLGRQRAERIAVTTRIVTDALAETERIHGQAQETAGDLSKWSAAVSAARQARDLVAAGEADETLRGRVAAVLAGLEREQAAAERSVAEVERDRKVLGELEAIRATRSEHWDEKRTDAEYAEAFRRIGIDLDQLEPEEAGRQIARRSRSVELASFLDDWAAIHRYVGEGKDDSPWRRLLVAARVADPDPWRAALRERIGRNERAALDRLADDVEDLDVQPASSLILLAATLNDQGDSERTERVLRRAWRSAPDDFWVNHALGYLFSREGPSLHPEEGTRFYSAAVAIRPRSWAAHYNLGRTLGQQGKLDQAIAEYQMALRLKPDYAEAHNNLGNILRDQGRLEESIAAFRAALGVRPDFSDAHNNIGNALNLQGKLDEAIIEYRTAVRLRPDDFAAHNNLGCALRDRGELEEAIAELRVGVQLQPNGVMGHYNLGVALRSGGEYAAAIAEMRKARDLAKTAAPHFIEQIDPELKTTEQLASLVARLSAVLSGETKPTDAVETLGFARLCYEKRLHGASVRFWAEALQAQPKLADDLRVGHRYNAACAAALAGCGQGKDDPPLDRAAKARWRKQAIDWLKADLAAWLKILENALPQARQSISQTLQHWKADTDLAGLREPAELAKLADDEQKACRALWVEVDALVKKARAANTP